MKQEIEDALAEKLARAMLTDFARVCGASGEVKDDHPLWQSFRNEAKAAMPAVREFLSEMFQTAAGELAERYQDPNPLASVFKPYVGAQIVEELREMAHEVGLPPQELAQRRTCTWPSCLSKDEQQQLAAEVIAGELGPVMTPTGPDAQKRCGCVDDEEQVDPLAQSGVDTPECDCGHAGMALKWHLRACTWVKQGRKQVKEGGCRHPGCGHSQERHMGDRNEKGCYICWDSPGNDGWKHPFTA